MSADVRTILKNFNRDLLLEELEGSALPFQSYQLSGFERFNRFEGQPTSEPRRLSRILQSDGKYIEDFAAPGELRFEFSGDLTVAEDTALDTLLSSHDSTQRTSEQQRENKDKSDLDTLIAQWSNVDNMNNTQLRNYVKLLARVVLRERKAPPI